MGETAYKGAAQRVAFYDELIKMMDANKGQPIQSVSAVDYLNMLIDDGEIEPPPEDYSSVGTFTSEKAKQSKAHNDWMNKMLKTVAKNGVTENSETPSFDSKRKIFVDVLGKGFKSYGNVANGKGTYFNPWSYSIDWKDGRAVNGEYSGIFNMTKSKEDMPWYLSGSRFSQEAREMMYQVGVDRAANVWSDPSDYVPFSMWGAKKPSQKEMQKAMPVKPETLIANRDEALNKARDKDIEFYKDKFKDLIGKGEIPNGDSIDEYLSFEASGDLGKAFSYQGLIDTKSIRSPKTKIIFDSFDEYKNATPDQLKAADIRRRIDTRRHLELQEMDWNKTKMKWGASMKAFRSGVGTVALSLLSGGVFAATGATSALANYAGMSQAAAGGVLTGATTGAFNGGVEGALKGAIAGGIGGYALDAYNNAGGVSGITGLGEAADLGIQATGAPDIGNTSYNPLPTADAAMAGNYAITPNTGNVFADNLGSTIGASGALPDLGTIGTGAGSLADNLVESGINNASNQIADAVVGGNDPAPTNTQAPVNNSSNTGSGGGVAIGGLTGGVFGNNRAKGKRFERSATPSTPYQFSGGINQNTSQPIGLLNEQQKRV